MPVISEETLDLIRERVDIVDVISGYVQLKRAGRSYKGLCPFHQEKTPSFSVNPEKQLYYCFGCGAGGNVFNFIMAIEGLDFVEAAVRLAEKAGVRITTEKQTSLSAKGQSGSLRERLFAVNQAAAGFFAASLMGQAGGAARAYLGKRGISMRMVERFQLGYADQAWDSLVSHLESQGFALEDCIAAGLALPGKGKPYDRFRNRLMFPIWNERGQVIAFGGRAIASDDQPKYLNTSETAVFSKGSNLYALNLAKDSIRRSRKVVIVEGYTDVISLHQHDITNAVASLGTAFTDKQARLLSRFAETVYICFDGDAAGEAATWRGLDLLSSVDLRVAVMTLPQGHDPDSLARSEGGAAFRELMEKALPLTEFKVTSIISRHDCSSITGKVAAVQELVPVLVELTSPVEREEYIRRIAKELNVGENSLLAELRSHMEKQGRGSRSRINLGKNGDSKKDSGLRQRKQFQSESLALETVPTAEEGLLKLMLYSHEAIAYVHRHLPLEYIKNTGLRRLALRLIELHKNGKDGTEFAAYLEGDLASLAAKICSKGELVPPIKSLNDYIVRLRFAFLQELLSGIENDLSNAGPCELAVELVRYKRLRDACKKGGSNIDELCITAGRGERNEQ